MADIIPLENVRKLRACMLCSLIKSVDQFLKFGCENCESLLMLQGDQERVQDCTSPNFEGTIGMINPGGSWVAKWF
jgi:transcription elongation factor SPT4